MIDRILNMVLRTVVRMAVKKGVNTAVKAGGAALSKRKAWRAQGPRAQETIDQNARRKLRPDERRGDDILYPTDDYTEPMQPRR